MNENLSLLHDGDSFVLELLPEEKHVRVLRILRYENNQNVEASSPRFFDLNPRTRDAIIRQIQRRHPGKTVKL